MEQKSLFDSNVLEEVKARIDAIQPSAAPQWGKMSPAQMLAHCAEVQEVLNGKPLLDTPFIVMLMKGMIRKMVVGTKPYPHESRTHPQYIMKGEFDFQKEKERLVGALNQGYADVSVPRSEHTLFGAMTADESGWAGYKHLDHHLTQFGA